MGDHGEPVRHRRDCGGALPRADDGRAAEEGAPDQDPGHGAHQRHHTLDLAPAPGPARAHRLADWRRADPQSVVEAGEPRDEEPTHDRERRHPEGDPHAARRQATAAAKVTATDGEVGRAVRSRAGESSNWRDFSHLLYPTGWARVRLRPPQYAQ